MTASASLSANANTLSLFADFFGVVGFFLCFGAFICQRGRRASVAMDSTGRCLPFATISDFLSILGT